MRWIVLVLISVLALTGLVLWFALPEREPGGSSSQEQESPAAFSELPPSALAPAPAPQVEADAVELAPAPTTSTREAADPAQEAEFTNARWVSGRVLFPPGTPGDEVAFVVADNQGISDWEIPRKRPSSGAERSNHRARVAPDGSFRVPFHEKTRRGQFRLEARYLFLPEGVRWRWNSTDTVELKPQLGGRIVGTVRLPAGADPSRVVGEVTLEGPGPNSRSNPAPRLSFAFDALLANDDSEHGYAIGFDGEDFLGRSEDLAVVAGKTLRVELELQAGITLRGVVHDENGAPLVEAWIEARSQNHEFRGRNAERTTVSAPDGTFHIGGLAPGSVTLMASFGHFLPHTRELGELEDGTVLENLVVVLERGQSIAGTVLWPDGTPARASVQLEPLQAGLSVVGGTSDMEGVFDICGLSADAYRVRASAMKRVRSEPTKALGRKWVKVRVPSAVWRSESAEVPVGTKDLVITLSAGLTLAGSVVDDRGAPLSAFSVNGKRVGLSSFLLGDSVNIISDDSGSFLVEGLTAGEWELTASDEHARSEPLRVTLPANASVVLVVPREAIVTGRVLDPYGVPFAGSQVLAIRDDESTTTDHEGFFQIGGLGPGPLRLRAYGGDHAPSEPLVVELTAGETVSGLELRLRPGGRILGELIGADGRPMSGVSILFGDGDFQCGGTETDGDGFFEAKGVPPGEIQVWAETPEGEVRRSVTLAEGETVSIRLAAPPK